MDALNKIEGDKIFTEKMSGVRSDRSGFTLALTAILNYRDYFSFIKND